MSAIRLVCLDMAGTTVADGGQVIAAFEAALDELRVRDSDERDRMIDYAKATMGESKITVFRALFDGDEALAQQGNSAFEKAYDKNIDEAEPLPHAEEAISTLRSGGIKVCLTTGFSRTTADRILDRLGWRGLVDLTLTPAEAGRGRPFPDLVLSALMRLEIEGVHQVAVAGDTAGDMASGRNAGASIVAGVLTGAHDRERLFGAGATHVLDGVGDLPALIARSQPPSTPSKGSH